MNYFYKALILAVDIMMAVTLGLEIRDRISARKKNKDTEVADPELVGSIAKNAKKLLTIFRRRSRKIKKQSLETE